MWSEVTLCDPVDCSPLRLLCPWDSTGKNTGVGCHFLLQGIFPTEGSNLGLLHCRQTLYPLSHREACEYTHANSNSVTPIMNLSSVIQNWYFYGHKTTDCFQIGKGVCQGCILSPCLFNLYAEYIMRNAGQNEAQAGIKITGKNINNLRYEDDTTLMSEREEELKCLLMKVKEESEKLA